MSGPLLAIAVSVPAVAPAAEPGPEADPVRLEVTAEPMRPYVQARTYYRVRILTQVPLRRPTLSDPKAEGALIHPIGDDRQWNETRDGQRLKVWERTYLVVPQRTGHLRIAGPRLSAGVPATRAHRDDADAGLSGLIDYLDSIQRQAPDLALVVRPPPAAAGAPWLPAESVSISEQWSPPDGQVHVGIPVTRSIRIEATGVAAAQLPEIPVAAGEGFKVYSEQPALSERISGNDLLSTKSLQVSYVPTAAGSWQVPALSVPWWSIGMDAPRKLRLPVHRLEAVGGASAAGADAQAAAGADAEARRRFTRSAADDLWRGPWLNLLLGLGWLVTLLLWWLDRRVRRANGADGSPGARPERLPPGLGSLVLRFDRACRAGDAEAARTALLEWGRARWPALPPRGPLELFSRLGVDNDARAQAYALERCLYGAETDLQGEWDGAAALAALKPLLNDASRPPPGTASQLPPLYPAGAGATGPDGEIVRGVTGPFGPSR